MKGLFSLTITVFLGYMMWVYLSPPLQPYLSSISAGSFSGSNIGAYAAGWGNHFKSLL